MLAIGKLIFTYLSFKALSEMALTAKYRATHAWILFFTSGITTMLLAVSAFIGYPYASLHYYALAIGINILTHTIALLGLGTYTK